MKSMGVLSMWRALFALWILQAAALCAYHDFSYTAPADQECIIYEGVTYSPSGRPGLVFYNACLERRIVRVCLIDSWDDPDLHTSFQPVPDGGRLTIYPRSDRVPDEVIVSSGRYDAPVPESCLSD